MDYFSGASFSIDILDNDSELCGVWLLAALNQREEVW